MAKPIRKTPTLKGEYANQFIATMIKTSDRTTLTANEREFVKLISK